jgi:hypothetical protein
MCDYRWGLDWWLNLLTAYTFMTHDYTLQNTDRHRLVSSITVSTSGFYHRNCNSLTELHKVSLHSQTFNWALLQLTLFFTASHTELNYQLTFPLLITSQHRPHRKHHSSIAAFMSVAMGTCLPSCCPEKAVAQTTENTVHLLLHVCMLWALPSNSRCLQSYRLARGLYATLYRWKQSIQTSLKNKLWYVSFLEIYLPPAYLTSETF